MKTTFRSKILMLVALMAAVFMGGMTVARATEANPGSTAGAVTPERTALAKQYIALVPVEDDVKAAVNQIANNVAPDQRVLFRSIADSTIDYAKLRSEAEKITAELFTDAEIKAMTAFYGSPEGKSIKAKMTTYESRMSPVMTQVMQAFVLKLQENNIQMMPAGTLPPATPGQP